MAVDEIYSRRSIRSFTDADISNQAIEAIVDAGRMAPSAKNRQPWKVFVYRGSAKEQLIQTLEKGISDETSGKAVVPGFAYGIADAKNTVRVMREAPVVAVILNWNGRSPFETINVEERFVEICDSLSIGAFIQNMLLKAQEMGIGSLWIGNTCFAYDRLMDYIGEEGQLIGAVAFGYPNQQPDMRPRADLSEILQYKM